MGHLLDALQQRRGDGAAQVDDRVGHLATGAVLHVLHVDVLAADDVQEAVEHTGHIVVDGAEPRLPGPLQAQGRHIDGVSDIAVQEIVRQLLGGHDRALLRALLLALAGAVV